MVSEEFGQPGTPGKAEEDSAMRLYKPKRHKPPSGRGYEGAKPWSSTPLHAPYEQSFITIEEFPGQRFWTWGMFALLEHVGEDVLNELQDDGWEPWNDENREFFLLLENQFAQTLIVLETQGLQRYWARTSDLRHAQRYPVLLTYQSEEMDYPHMIPPEMVRGTVHWSAKAPPFTSTPPSSSAKKDTRCVPRSTKACSSSRRMLSHLNRSEGTVSSSVLPDGRGRTGRHRSWHRFTGRSISRREVSLQQRLSAHCLPSLSSSTKVHLSHRPCPCRR